MVSRLAEKDSGLWGSAVQGLAWGSIRLGKRSGLQFEHETKLHNKPLIVAPKTQSGAAEVDKRMEDRTPRLPSST